jgi:hypothetical protein
MTQYGSSAALENFPELEIRLAIRVTNDVSVARGLRRIDVDVVVRPHIRPVRMRDPVDQRVDVDEEIPLFRGEQRSPFGLNLRDLQQVIVQILRRVLSACLLHPGPSGT